MPESVDLLKPIWGIPENFSKVAFVGKDVVAVASDVFIFFTNLKTGIDNAFAANSQEAGHGIECFQGHHTGLFVFAEKSIKPRILAYAYPQCQKLSELEDDETESYLAIGLLEGELLVSFTGYPNFKIEVWNWRAANKLASIQTDVMLEDQIFSSSKTHQLVCQIWDEGLNVWEVGECFKNCILMKRTSAQTGCAIADICFTPEGHLHLLDELGSLYNITSDGIHMTRELEWAPSNGGDFKPFACAISNGVLTYCTDGTLKFIRKLDKKWVEIWGHTDKLDIVQMLSNYACDMAVLIGRNGRCYRVTYTEENNDSFDVALVAYKQRNLKNMQLLAPEGNKLFTVNDSSELCVYDSFNGALEAVYKVNANNLTIRTHPTLPVLAVCGEVVKNYGLALFSYGDGFIQESRRCLTEQIVSRVVFSKDGKFITACALDAGHIFIMKINKEWKLDVVKYIESGRGIVDCNFCTAGGILRVFYLVLYSDQFRIGEKLMSVEVYSGRENKVAGKMQGPYQKMIPMGPDDLMAMVPHLSTQYHLLALAAAGATVNVKLIKVVDTGHGMKCFKGALCGAQNLFTYGVDGQVILQTGDGNNKHILSFYGSNKYGGGIDYVKADHNLKFVVTKAHNRTLAVSCFDESALGNRGECAQTNLEKLAGDIPELHLFDEDELNWLDIIEADLVEKERIQFQDERASIVQQFEEIQKELVALLEENIAAPPLHQLSVIEFDLNHEVRQARIKLAADEREKLRKNIQASIAKQDKVTKWMRENFWDIMKIQRAKCRAIFSYYEVENYSTLPDERNSWIELQRVKAWRELELLMYPKIFTPWMEEHEKSIESDVVEGALTSSILILDIAKKSQIAVQTSAPSTPEGSIVASVVNSYALSGTLSHMYITVPSYDVEQMHMYSYLHTRYWQELSKLKTFLLREWFNKEFENLVSTKIREVGLVKERNNRLRVIISELNKLADLRGSVNMITNVVTDPVWEQDEEPHRIMAVDQKEVSIPPYISPSQIVIPPPTPKPKDDFKERALMDMMDGVLEKLWHEEIKRPIPKPQCMIEKEPENWNEDDLKLVFDYEKKVEFRNSEREHYRRMLHNEWIKLSEILNDGIVRFNAKVKDTFVVKLNVESAIGQENLNLMRTRRSDLDRLEKAEAVRRLRMQLQSLEKDLVYFQREFKGVQNCVTEYQAAYDAQQQRDRQLERNFKNYFTDQSPVVLDISNKIFKRRPKWLAKAATASILWAMAQGVIMKTKPLLLPLDFYDYLKGIDALDALTNMPAVMEERIWNIMCNLRREKIENEIKMRALVAETAAAESTGNLWVKRISATKHAITYTKTQINELLTPDRNMEVQIVLPAGVVEVPLTGHFDDFKDAAIVLKDDVEEINQLILKVGAVKLSMIKKQITFRASIIAKEWEHELVKIKIKHMKEELYNYERIKLPKELQTYLKDKYEGYPEDEELTKLEKDAEAARNAHRRHVGQLMAISDALEDKTSAISAKTKSIEDIIYKAILIISEKRLAEKPEEVRKFVRNRKKRMDAVVERNKLAREIQENYTTLILLQAELDVKFIKTYPTLSKVQYHVKGTEA